MTRLALAALLTLALAGCSDEAPAGRATPQSPATTSAPPTAASSATPTPTTPTPTVPTPTAVPPTASTPPDEAGSEGGVVLGGQDLGVTRLGVPMDEAVAAVSAVLGEPDEDPAATVRCLQSDREVRWDELVLAAERGRLAGWTSQSTTVQTPSGVAKGTPVAALRQVYGDRFERFPANADNPPTFAVRGVDVLGGLSSAGDDAEVTVLHSRFCSGP